METIKELKLAVLIDADNVPYSNVRGMLEEIAKYAVAAIAILWRREAIRRSIDLVTCMLTVALGFAAVENMLFLIGPLSQGDYILIPSHILHKVTRTSSNPDCIWLALHSK